MTVEPRPRPIEKPNDDRPEPPATRACPVCGGPLFEVRAQAAMLTLPDHLRNVL